jgi:hypothetical protein
MPETYSLLSIPFYISTSKCYIKAFALDRMPSPGSPLSQIVKRTVLPKLSTFQQGNECDPYKTCGNIVMNPHNILEYARPDDIPLIFTWLIQHGYTIDTSITKMINDSTVRMSNPILCFVSR